MAQPRLGALGSTLLAAFLLAESAAATDEDDAELAFNLFSDVAPILALFGEQFARQFMSESLVWLDHFIFAMVPLGIIASVTGAIRAQGPSIAKAFIGRVRENMAQVEFELMSSTSHEVGEAFNGKGIVRVLGRPTIATFLLFPKNYHDVKTYYDMKARGDTPSTIDDATLDSCGIHSLNTVVYSEPSLMSYQYYHSSTRGLLQSILSRLGRLQRRASRTFITKSGCNNDEEIGLHAMTEASTHNDTLPAENAQRNVDDASKNQVTSGINNENKAGASMNWGKGEEDAEDPPRKEVANLGPPNLQLNLASDHVDNRHQKKHFELMVAAALALVTQAGLIVLAAMTTTYAPLRDRIVYNPKPYGLPCYVAGSLLLSAGVGFCSHVVGRKTTEVSWTATQSKQSAETGDWTDCPRLMYVQKRQVVNDQAFGAYVLLAGHKNKVVASTRRQASHKHEPFWEWATVAAAVAAGVGFTTQFMGLRGLTYPSSIAQILAIVGMTVIRAIIRRRLGRPPSYQQAVAEYELDYLATNITADPNFGESSEPEPDYQRNSEDGKHFHWKINLPALKDESSAKYRSDASKTQSNSLPTNNLIESHKLPVSGEQLLRVRKRLGDLTLWRSKTSKHAVALCKSMEAFMDAFFPNGIQDSRDGGVNLHLWSFRLDATGASGDASIKLSLRQLSNSWVADVGRVEASLSLWMASLEEDRENKQKEVNDRSTRQTDRKYEDQSNWRRTDQGGDVRKHNFYRILGEDDKEHILRRDLAWWTGYQAPVPEPINDKFGGGGGDAPVIGFERDLFRGKSSQTSRSHLVNQSSVYKDDQVERLDAREDVGELTIQGEMFLPDILIQHLFTRFVWAVSKTLPSTCLPLGFLDSAREVEIEGRDRLDLDNLKETWTLPKLSHQKLTTLVSHMEDLGLGSRTDILFCIIPAFSGHDLLPNRAMLQLIPLVPKDHAWTTLARQYRQLMETSLRTNKPELLCYFIVIQIMDFLYIAHQPYDEIIRPEDTFNAALRELVVSISQLGRVLEILEPLHNHQQRQDEFQTLFGCYESDDSTSYGLYKYGGGFGSHDDRLSLALGMSTAHQDAITRSATGVDLEEENEELAIAPDVFGWTPLHYSCTSGKRRKQLLKIGEVWDRWEVNISISIKNLPTLLDRLRRNPIHVAAMTGSFEILTLATESADTDKIRASISASGVDGMTPLHLAAASRHECLRRLLQQVKRLSMPINPKDIWGREPLHITARKGGKRATNAILEAGGWSLTTDLLGRTPIDYLLTAGKGDEEDADDRVGRFQPRVTDPDRLAIMVNISLQSRTWQDDKGRSLLHRAIETTNAVTVEMLAKHVDPNLADRNGETPLHYALVHHREDVALSLIKKWNADPCAAAGDGRTPLMLAAERNLDRAVTLILHTGQGGKDAQDIQGRTAFHYAMNIQDGDQALVSMFEQLARGGCNPATVNPKGRTVLNDALAHNCEPIYNFLLTDSAAVDLWKPDFFTGLDSPLIDACREGCPKSVIQRILGLWPNLLNVTNGVEHLQEVNHTPISIACQRDHVHIVKLLAAQDETNLNNSVAEVLGNVTTLHIAAERGNLNSLAILLQYAPSRIKLDSEAHSGETPMTVALDGESLAPAKMILLYDLLSHQEHRKDYLSGLRGLAAVNSRAMFSEFLDDVASGPLTDDDFVARLVEIVLSVSGADEAALVVLKKALEGTASKCVPTLYHVAVKADSAELLSKLQQTGADPAGVDEDGWSWEYLAIRCGRTHLVDLSTTSIHSTLSPGPREYQDLLWPDWQDFGSISSCNDHHGHLGCPGVSVIHVNQSSSGSKRICIRSKHPLSPSRTFHYCYFEVKVLRASESRILGVGFCRQDYPTNVMPGWYHGSWAYHGDDGGLYVEDGKTCAWPASKSSSSTKFSEEADDVVGVYLDLKTGESFCTLNGRRLKYATRAVERIKAREFHHGKIYPCVGFSKKEDGVGLCFQINFGGSAQHPFVYKGPEIAGGDIPST